MEDVYGPARRQVAQRKEVGLIDIAGRRRTALFQGNMCVSAVSTRRPLEQLAYAHYKSVDPAGQVQMHKERKLAE